nr:hypothetical protein [Streptomyces sp. REN17]
MYVPVRLAAAALAVATSAGCMSVGDDGGSRAEPSHSAARQGGEAPDGGAAVSGARPGRQGASDGKHARAKPGRSASGPASPSARRSGASRSAAPEKPGKDHDDDGKKPRPRVSSPTKAPSTPTRPAPEPTPTKETPVPSPDPTTAEPSSSAHPEPEPQLFEFREPAPKAGFEA